jgi:hypothetical protein
MVVIAGVATPATAGSDELVADPPLPGVQAQSTDDAADGGKLIVSPPSGHYSFGYAVAIDGDVLAIGAPSASGNQGKAFILYDFVDTTTFAVYGLTCEHNFSKFPDGDCGRAVAVDGNRVAVGMPHWPNEATQLDDRGAVWVVDHDGDEWISWPLVRGSVLGGYFGEAVALDESTLVVGAPLTNINAASSRARVYIPSGEAGNGHWELEQTLEPDGEDTNFAWNVDLAGTTLALGATAAASIFRGDPGGFDETQELTMGEGEYGQLDVAIDGEWLVVGNHDEGGSPPGAVHVYKWNGAKYAEVQVLTPPDGDHELYGWSVAIHGDTILVGDPRDHGEASYAGAVHRYRRSGTQWSYVDTLTAFDAAAEDQFGWDVAISAEWIIVGAPWDDNDGGTDSGAIYVYANTAVPPPGDTKCNGIEASIVGTDGNDELQGTPGFDVIAGLGGHDVIAGVGGDDLICGGTGNDLILGGFGDDTLIGGTGNDVIEGHDGNDIIEGGGGDDRLAGGAGSDIVKGNRGTDTLKGGGGVDYLYGGGGRDVLVGGTGGDYLWGGKGADLASYAGAGAGIDVDLEIGIVSGGAGIDLLTSIRDLKGSRFADELIGNAGANRLKGLGGNDVIYGKAGDDVLKGGAGTDAVYGGFGSDRCIAETKVACEL